MTLATLEFGAEVERMEGSTMNSDREGITYLYIYSKAYGERAEIGEIPYAGSLLPTGERESYEITITFTESPQGVATSVDQQRSIAEHRADYMGIDEHEQAYFVLRAPDATDYDSRTGWLRLKLKLFPEEKALDFLDLSKEWRPYSRGRRAPDEPPEHYWPGGKPYDSYYVTVEMEQSPGGYENPPRW